MDANAPMVEFDRVQKSYDGETLVVVGDGQVRIHVRRDLRIRGNARISRTPLLLVVHRDMGNPRPGVVNKRGNPKTASFGFKADTVIRCHRESTHREAKGWA